MSRKNSHQAIRFFRILILLIILIPFLGYSIYFSFNRLENCLKHNSTMYCLITQKNHIFWDWYNN